jgi:haloalkane dehalogenase
MNPALPDLLQVLYPFSPQYHSCSEGKLHYIDEGCGEPLVFLHGNPTWSFFYRNLILDLQDSYRCLALDHLGCGLSDKPQQARYTLDGHIGRACDWLRGLGLESFQLVVHDWGGAIGFGVARELQGMVSRIHVLNTAAFPFRPVPWRIAMCRIPLLGSYAIRQHNLFARKATELTTVEPLAPAVRDGYLFPYANAASRLAIDAFVKDIPTSPRHRSWATLKAIEESLGAWRERPLQIIWGMQDWCFHSGVLQRWRELLPDAPVHTIEQAGHYLTEDAPEEICTQIRAFART